MNSINNTDYYKQYMLYKAKYFLLKKQKGGQVTFDPMDDNYLGNNSLKEIMIKMVDKSGDNIQYKKIIRVKAGDEKGTVYTKDFNAQIVNKRDIDRGEIEKLLSKIDSVYQLPNPNNSDIVSSFDLYIKYGNKIWPNNVHNNKNQSREIVSFDQQDIYNNIVTQILSF